MMKKGLAIGLTLAIGISGCANLKQEPVAKKVVTFTDQDKISIVLPKVESSSAKEVFSKIGGLSYSKYLENGSVRFINNWESSENSFKVTRSACGWVSGNCNFLRNSTVTIDGSLVLENTDASSKIVLYPQKYNQDTTSNFLTGQPHFSWLDLSSKDLKETLSSAGYPWKFEVNSEFPGDAVYANFQRLSRAEKSSGQGYTDDVTGKIFKERFWLKVGTSDIPVTIETYPYRNGSKVIVNAKLSPVVSGNELNYVEAIKLLEQRVKEIVNS
ncbi:hypothetical protein [Spongiibacter tropicus]|uniref:hypothetical protein n=1 Tax=Spongiibacter tropicus TaxID=454602 RepID=UPI0012F8C525|nr:hypothetical protein [Spongiibacter tropicus]